MQKQPRRRAPFRYSEGFLLRSTTVSVSSWRALFPVSKNYPQLQHCLLRNFLDGCRVTHLLRESIFSSGTTSLQNISDIEPPGRQQCSTPALEPNLRSPSTKAVGASRIPRWNAQQPSWPLVWASRKGCRGSTPLPPGPFSLCRQG